MKNKKIYIIFLILIVFFTCSIVKKTFENDTYFYIALGKSIVQNHGIDGYDHISFHNDLKFPYQSWICYVFFYLIYNQFGYMGIYVSVMIVTSCIAMVLFNIMRTNHSNIGSFFITLLIMSLSVGTFAARSQIFSFLIFILEYYCLYQLLENDKKKYFFVLLILSVLLVNCHSTLYPLFFVIMLPYLAEIILNKVKWLNKNNRFELVNLKNEKIFILAIFLCVFIGLITPIFGSAYITMFLTLNGVSNYFVSEMQKVNLLDCFPILLIFTFSISILSFSETKIRLKDLLYIIGFLILSLMAQRSTYFMYFFGIISLFNIFACFLERYNDKKELTKKIKEIENSRLIIIFILLFVLVLSVYNFSNKFTDSYVDDLDCPINATNYILDNIDYNNSKIWTHYNFGSYLESYDIKVFLDSRAELFDSQINKNSTILTDWFMVKNGEKIIKKFLINMRLHMYFYIIQN